MQYVYAVASFLGGLGAFLIGVKLLSESMEKLANNRLKSLFNKTSKNGFVGVGIGLVSTMVVQSSSLTTVMVVGLVNAGIMSLYQATTIIMGANIGTTITAQIAALQTFDFISLAMALTSVGAFTAMFAKKDGTKATPDDAKLVPWLKANGFGDYVKTEESAKWGELKKGLTFVGSVATIIETGEIVEGITVTEQPDIFKVDL